MINLEVSPTEPNSGHPRDSKESFTASSVRLFDSVQAETTIPDSSPEPESAYLVKLWSNLPSITSFVPTFVKPTVSETTKALDKLRSNEDDSKTSVPMKTFSGTTKTTTSLSGVVARPKDFFAADNVAVNVTSNISSEVSAPIYSQRNESKVTIDSVPETDQFEFANVENSSSRRRRRARRRLQHGGVFSSLASWLPNLFHSSSSVSSPGFVQQLVLQALLSPSSHPSSEASDALGRRLYALMTSSTLTSRGYNNNLLASQFRPKLTSVTDDEASGDFDLMKPEDKKAALLVELRPIRPDFVPRMTLASRAR